MVVDLQIAPVALSFHWSRASALDDPAAGPKPPLRRLLEPHTRVALHVASPAAPAIAEPGDTLLGSATFAKLSSEGVGAGKRPGGWPVTLFVPPAAKKEEPPKSASKDKEDETAPHRMEAALRALKISQLVKLSPKCKPPKEPAAAGEAAPLPHEAGGGEADEALAGRGAAPHACGGV